MKINPININFPYKKPLALKPQKSICVDTFSFKGESKLDKIKKQLSQATDKNGEIYFTEEELQEIVTDIANSNIRDIDFDLLQNELLSTVDNSYKIYFEELKPFNGYQFVARKDIIEEDNDLKLYKIITLKNNGRKEYATLELGKDNIYRSWEKNVPNTFISFKDINSDITNIRLNFNKNNEVYELITNVRSKDLSGAYLSKKYTLSDYPEDMDFIELSRQNSLDKKIKELNLPAGTVIRNVTQKGRVTSYDEKFTTNGKTTIKHYAEKKNIFGQLSKYNYSYKILNEDGSTLFNTNRTWKKTKKGSTTTINGEKYSVEFDRRFKDTLIRITKSDKTTERLWPSVRINNNNKDIEKFLETLPADILLEMEECLKISIIDKTEDSKISNSDTVYARLYTSKNQTALAHELGHRKGKIKKVYENEELIEIYKKEVEIFNQNNTQSDKVSANYFLPESKSHINGLAELVAETNALMTIYGHTDDYGEFKKRIRVLSENFPETIAKAATLLGYNSIEN